MSALGAELTGRVWTFGDDIDTDLIMPLHTVFRPVAEQARYSMEANRPGWAEQVRAGDMLVAGQNFGVGSGRPGARVLHELGIACLLVESINGLFFRNCVNYALPALEVPGIVGAFSDGDDAVVDFTGATVRNPSSGVVLHGRPWPPELLDIVRAGGIMALLTTEGLLEPT